MKSNAVRGAIHGAAVEIGEMSGSGSWFYLYCILIDILKDCRESVMHMLWEMTAWLDRYVKNAPPRALK